MLPDARQGNVAGGEGVIGFYGSLTRSGMRDIFDSMCQHCGFSKDSVFVDIGAGIGR
jgi:hypothetical protein